MTLFNQLSPVFVEGFCLGSIYIYIYIYQDDPHSPLTLSSIHTCVKWGSVLGFVCMLLCSIWSLILYTWCVLFQGSMWYYDHTAEPILNICIYDRHLCGPYCNMVSICSCMRLTINPHMCWLRPYLQFAFGISPIIPMLTFALCYYLSVCMLRPQDYDQSYPKGDSTGCSEMWSNYHVFFF